MKIIVKVKSDLTGQKYGKLTVLNQVDDYISPKGEHKAQWLCRCDCGNEVVRIGNKLIKGKNQSCGCLQKDILSKIGKQNKKYNTYDLSGEYGIGWTSNTNEEFYFDLEDYDRIKDYCWRISALGYIETNDDNDKNIKMHRLIMGFPNLNIEIDHVHGETTRNDNRKENLRMATRSQNMMNRNIQSNNTSGVAGVWWDYKRSKWIAYININNERKYLGSFDSFEKAVKIRKKAEEKYFGEWAYIGVSN